MQQERTPLMEDLYQATCHNLPWEQFKYVVPAQYHYQNPNHHPPEPKPAPKLSYVDHLLRTKRTIPAPNAYSPLNQNRPLSGKMDRRPRTTMTEEAMAFNKKEQVPGPGAYQQRPKTADFKAMRGEPEPRQHYLNEVEYLSAEFPGVGQYNITQQRRHVRSPVYGKGLLQKSGSGRLRTEKSIKGRQGKDIGANTSSVVVGTFEWIALQKKPCHKNNFGKSRRFEGLGKQDRRPGPNAYKLNTNWADSAHIMKTSCSLSNFRGVYHA